VTARFASLQARAQIAVIAGVLLLVIMIGYFALIAPKRSTASDLKRQTAAVQKQIDANKSSGFTQALPAVRSASIFSIAKAMPKQLETANVILQLSQLAEASGITFDQITPGVSGTSATSAVPTTPDTTDPFAAEPIQVQFSGSFYDLIAFLQRLRNLVRIENGHLTASGRLFDVSDIAFCEVPSTECTSTQSTSASGSQLPTQTSTFPHVQAVLTINALVPQVPQVVATPTPGATDTTGTVTTTTTGTTTTTSNPTSAAPSTSGGTS
jgi:Tfp pilus assembly protein PilO